MISRVIIGLVVAFYCAAVLASSPDSKDGEKGLVHHPDYYLVVNGHLGTVFETGPDGNINSDSPFPIPDKYELVNDYLSVLQIAKSIEILKKLQALEKHNGTQIVLLTVPSTGNESACAYGDKVFTKWDLGNNGQGNGVLFVISSNGDICIIPGAGIQGALPDVKLARIVREIIWPSFRREEYVEGIEAAIDEMIKAARGEDTAPTFYYYLGATSEYFSPMLTFYDRLKLSITANQIVAGVLGIFGIIYAAVLFWHRRRQKKAAT